VAAKTLFSFANGTENWQANISNLKAGTTAQSANSAGNTEHSLQIDTTEEGWFGTTDSTPLPLNASEVTNLLFDITTTSVETSQSIAVQVGSNYQWCQTPWSYMKADTTTTVTVNLKDLISSARACGGSVPSDTSEIHGIWIYFSGGGTYFLNSVRVE
jgi:hypothetical protein